MQSLGLILSITTVFPHEKEQVTSAIVMQTDVGSAAFAGV